MTRGFALCRTRTINVCALSWADPTKIQLHIIDRIFKKGFQILAHFD